MPMMKKLFIAPNTSHWDIIEKETIDEVIFRTMQPRNRLMLELMARGDMRIGEVLKLTLGDIHDQKLIFRAPKSGREYECVFIPKKVSERLYDLSLKEGLSDFTVAESLPHTFIDKNNLPNYSHRINPIAA